MTLLVKSPQYVRIFPSASVSCFRSEWASVSSPAKWGKPALSAVVGRNERTEPGPCPRRFTNKTSGKPHHNPVQELEVSPLSHWAEWFAEGHVVRP